MTFKQWFELLCKTAVNQGHHDLINDRHPEWYREYFDDGDTPIDVISDEISALDLEERHTHAT